jgi:adenylylsulfate kinase
MDEVRRAGLVWLTGIPAAGKTTLAGLLAGHMAGLGVPAEVLDGDAFRRAMSDDADFSREGRARNMRRAFEVAWLLAKNGVWAIVALVSPYRDARSEIRVRAKGRGLLFIEVHVRCPVDVARQRDPKGNYRRALAGEILSFTGVSDPYEEPEAPEVLVDTALLGAEESAAIVAEFIARLGGIHAK